MFLNFKNEKICLKKCLCSILLGCYWNWLYMERPQSGANRGLSGASGLNRPAPNCCPLSVKRLVCKCRQAGDAWQEAVTLSAPRNHFWFLKLFTWQGRWHLHVLLISFYLWVYRTFTFVWSFKNTHEGSRYIYWWDIQAHCYKNNRSGCVEYFSTSDKHS